MVTETHDVLHRLGRDDTRHDRGRWPEVPSWLEQVFLQGLQGANAPVPIPGLDHICAALHSHFLNSTYQIHNLAGESHTIDQYINLVKAQWLLSKVCSGDAQRGHHASSVYLKFISDMEALISEEFRRSGLIQAADDALRLRLEENPAAFSIWPPPPPSRLPRRSTDPEPVEEELDISPPLVLDNAVGDGGRLICFRKRENHSILRLVPVSGLDNRPHPTYQPFRMNTSPDRFIPLYAIDQTPGPKRVRIHHANGAGFNEFAFKDIDGAQAFQRVVTGYMVVGDQESVTWTGHPSIGRVILNLRRGLDGGAEARGSGSGNRGGAFILTRRRTSWSIVPHPLL